LAIPPLTAILVSNRAGSCDESCHWASARRRGETAEGSSAAEIDISRDIVGVAFLEWFEVPEVRGVTIHSSSRLVCRGRDRQIGRNLEEERCGILDIYETGRRKTLES
jgi:hypothetical protein